jgi:hypothetical protein
MCFAGVVAELRAGRRLDGVEVIGGVLDAVVQGRIAAAVADHVHLAGRVDHDRGQVLRPEAEGDGVDP